MASIAAAMVCLVGVLLWQKLLASSLETDPVNCGGDFSYIVKCPAGSFCKMNKSDPLGGGYCTPYMGYFSK